MKIPKKLLKLFPFYGRFSIRENVTYTLRDKDGNIKPIFAFNWLGKTIAKFFGAKIPQIRLFGSLANSMTISNLITNTGFAGVASRLNGDGAEAVFTYIAIGTGTTAADVTDTTLETEIASGGGSRATGTASRSTTDVTDDTAELTKIFTFTSSFAITEAGCLNAASSGVLLARQVFAAVNVANTDQLQVTWKFDID